MQLYLINECVSVIGFCKHSAALIEITIYIFEQLQLGSNSTFIYPGLMNWTCTINRFAMNVQKTLYFFFVILSMTPYSWTTRILPQEPSILEWRQCLRQYFEDKIFKSTLCWLHTLFDWTVHIVHKHCCVCFLLQYFITWRKTCVEGKQST